MIISIKQRLAQGEIVRVLAFASLASPKLVEIAGLAGGFQGMWIDQEHSAIPHRELELLLIACRAAGLDAFVRVAPTDYATVMRPMETGASGVMVAQIRSVDQVRQIVQWAKYPPMGVRGLFLANYEAGYGSANPAEHLPRANRERWLCVQIETAEAVECAHEIAAVEGVDSLFVGPSDLSCTLGVPGQAMHPKCIAAMERVSAAVKNVGKTWGVLARSPEHAAKCREMGCQLFSLAGDVDLIHRGFHATKKMYPEFFG
jgi:2-dehydro-3-deoxyglucarate aldolase/4-hydroxy-2-oxoheptanedioate aldolase